MNMHGIMTPIDNGQSRQKPALADRIRAWVWPRRMFLLVVVLPAIVVGGYLYLVASDQYESEAHFMVRNASNPQVAPASGLGQALSFVTGSGSGQSEAMSVADYLISHDVVDELRKHDRLVERFNRSGVDPPEQASLRRSDA